MMQLADLLKERVDMDCDEVWENERSPTPPSGCSWCDSTR